MLIFEIKVLLFFCLFFYTNFVFVFFLNEYYQKHPLRHAFSPPSRVEWCK